MIRLECPHCGAKLRVPDTLAGKEGRCPRCKKTLAVPQTPEPELELVRDETAADAHVASELLDQRTGHPSGGPGRRRGNVLDRQQEQELLASLGPLPAPEQTGERKLIWWLDILMYPMTLSGVIALIVIAVAPFLAQLIHWSVLLLARGFFWPNIVIALYAAWYLAECAHDSAKGGTRAPDVFTADTRPSELWSRVSYLALVYIFFILPPVIYWLFMHRLDAILLGLVAWSVVFFPMGLLAMVINDATFVLNPVFLLGAISRVFLAYVSLLLVIMASVYLFLLIFLRMPGTWRGIMAPLIAAYISLILAHILGRFYWRYRDRLDWGL